MTGIDLGESFRGKYKTAKGAARELRRKGFDDCVALAASHFERIPVSFARVGDLVAIPEADFEALGVIIGAQVAVVSPAGLGIVPLSRATRAFRV
jgi:hypothetical protein